MIPIRQRSLRAVLLAALPMALAVPAGAGPPKHRGLYAIWYYGKPQVLELPFITGGQAIVQWADVHPAEGRYDFSKLVARLKPLHEAGMPATVQINGNVKPAWLFEKVPHHPDKLGHQVADKRGTLMYWHPVHEKAYLDFLQACAKFLKTSPYGGTVLGVRLNFNALGTEHLGIPKDKRALKQWIVPKGADPGQEWTLRLGQAYRAKVVRTFVQHFPPQIRVFVRNNIDEALQTEFRKEFETGKLSWFHTSTEAEPRSQGTERQYQTFLKYCRTGKTLAYAECWASAWGHHGGKTDPRWCSPPQWNYWRLLADLHCGVSFIAAYGSDLDVALRGTYQGKDVSSYKDEFREAFQFAAKYAGYHASPEDSPGAWVAFREGNFLKGDYTFLARRLPDRSKEARNVGPDDQRYGAWARVLPKGETMRVVLDDRFAKSLSQRKAVVQITVLDDGDGTLTVRASGRELSVPLKNTGRWRTAALSLQAAAWEPDRSGAHLTVAADRDVHLHMVEVVPSRPERSAE